MSIGLVLRNLSLLVCLLYSARFHASEVGRPLMDSWGSAEIGVGAQLWRVRVLPDGRVVIGHNQGLSIFDGSSFELLSLPGGTAHDFRVAADGEAWAGTPTGLGSFVADAQGRWRFHARPLPAEAPIPGPIGRVMLSGGWTHFLARQAAYAWHPQRGWRWHAATTRFAELRDDGDAALLLEPGTGWFRFDSDAGRWQPHPWPDFPAAEVFASSEEVGEPWYFSDRQQIWRQAGGRVEALALQNLPELQAARIESLARLPDGGVAVGTRFAGLYQFDTAGVLTRRIAPSQLPGERVSDIDVDAQGQLWLAIDGGLVRIAADDHLSRWDRQLGAFQIERIVRAGSTLHVATRVGLKRLLPPANPGEPARLELDRISRTSVWDLLATPYGGALVGTGNGLSWLPDDGSDARLLHAGPRVSALVAADPAATLVYAVAGDRLWRIRRSGGDYHFDDAEFRFLPMHDARLQDGRLWASIDGGGAVAFGDLARWPELTVRRFGEAEGVHRSRLNFSQALNRLLLLGRSNHEVTPAGELGPSLALQGLPLLDQLVSIGGDRYRAIHTDGHLLSLRRAADGRLQLDGAPLSGLMLPARHLLGEHDGTLWMAGENGLARVGSVFATRPATELRPWIASVQGGGQLLWAGARAPPAALSVPVDARQLEVRLALPGLTTELPPNWAWRTADDPSWVPLERAALHWLAPSAGRQRLTFRATDATGRVWLSAPLELQVQPLWHERLLARLGFLVAGLLLLALAASGWAHWRTRQLQREQMRLEAEVRTRTAEIRRQADEIRGLSEARTRFFAHVSHEFRTPLTLVLGPVGDALAGRHGALSAPLAGALHTARSSAERLLKLVNELLDLSRLAAGRFDLHLAEHDLTAQLRRELAGFANEAERRRVRLEGEGLSDPLLLAYDADQLERIVANLLGNALKFTPTGGRVTLRVVPTAVEVGIEVEDTGPGVPTAEQARIFERFQQGSAASPPDAPGTGIGLALVRELVDLHGGRVELISEAGQGACFAVWLPRRPAASLAPARVARPDPSTSSAAEPVAPVDADDGFGDCDIDGSRGEEGGLRPTVLVVDDHAEVRRYLAERLADVFEVRSARDGDEALALIAEFRPDLLVSDVMMPGLDGLGLLRVLRSDPDTAGVPVLLLSARAQSRDVIAGLEAGADDYLTKPFETGELIARLRALLDRRRWLRRDLLARGFQMPAGAVSADVDATSAATAASASVVDSSTEAPAVAADQRFRERLERCLGAHVGDAGFGVAELAEAMHMDRATLFRRVKALTGSSPSELLRERRLALAHALLQQRRGNVSEVAYAVGYESLSHFAQAFRRRYRVAPSAVLGAPPASAPR